MSIASHTPIHFVPGIGRRTAEVLHDLEIHTFGQFAHIPERILVELFGPSITQVTVFRVSQADAQVKNTQRVRTSSTSLFRRFSIAHKLAAVL